MFLPLHYVSSQFDVPQGATPDGIVWECMVQVSHMQLIDAISYLQSKHVSIPVKLNT